MASEITTIDEAENKRKGALLRAIGLDKVPVEQRELALAIAKRYELDLLLKHLVLIDGRPYITRDGLLWVAHRSGQLDGIEVSDPEVVEMTGIGSFWRATCSVFRKDMTRPFTYAGRYPTKGGNQRFAPEMAVKVAEVMSLRRAFNVSAPVLEERWDMDMAAPPTPRPDLRDQVAEKREAITSGRDSGAASVGPGGATTDPQVTSAVSERPPLPTESTFGEQGHLPSGQEFGADDSSDTANLAGARTVTPASQPGNTEAGIPTPAPSPDGSEVTPFASEPSDMPPPPETATRTCGDDGGMMGLCQRAPGHTRKHQGPGGEWPQERGR